MQFNFTSQHRPTSIFQLSSLFATLIMIKLCWHPYPEGSNLNNCSAEYPESVALEPPDCYMSAEVVCSLCFVVAGELMGNVVLEMSGRHVVVVMQKMAVKMYVVGVVLVGEGVFGVNCVAVGSFVHILAVDGVWFVHRDFGKPGSSIQTAAPHAPECV